MAARTKVNIFKEAVSELENKPIHKSSLGFTNLADLKAKSYSVYRSKESLRAPEARTVEDEIELWQEINKNYCQNSMKIDPQIHSKQNFSTKRQQRFKEENVQALNIKPVEAKSKNIINQDSRISFANFLQVLLVIGNLFMSLQIFSLLKNL